LGGFFHLSECIDQPINQSITSYAQSLIHPPAQGVLNVASAPLSISPSVSQSVIIIKYCGMYLVTLLRVHLFYRAKNVLSIVHSTALSSYVVCLSVRRSNLVANYGGV